MTIRKYIYDYEKVLQESDGSGVTQKEYTSTTDLYGDLLSAYDGTSAKYYEPDALGSTDALINESQTVTDRWKYRAFGSATATLGGTGNPFTWVGRQGYFSDIETGLYLLGSGTRYYDPAIAQFLSKDPLSVEPERSNDRNYADNSPTNAIDPSGFEILGDRTLPHWDQPAKGEKLPPIVCGDDDPLKLIRTITDASGNKFQLWCKGHFYGKIILKKNAKAVTINYGACIVPGGVNLQGVELDAKGDFKGLVWYNVGPVKGSAKALNDLLSSIFASERQFKKTNKIDGSLTLAQDEQLVRKLLADAYDKGLLNTCGPAVGKKVPLSTVKYVWSKDGNMVYRLWYDTVTKMIEWIEEKNVGLDGAPVAP